jgi:hypothetical protein
MRNQEAQLEMAPAQQRLDADDGAAAQVDLGLEVQLELTPLERVAQGGFEVHAFLRLLVHLRLVELVIGAAMLLGAVHGEVGVLDQGVRIVAVTRVAGHADTAVEEEVLAADRHRARHRLHDPVQHRIAQVAVAAFGQHQHEFVAAEARHGILRAHRRGQALRDRLQAFVAAAVADAVVDELEAVEVDEQHPHSLLVALRAGDFLAHPLAEQLAVDEAGQGVVRGLEFEFGFVAALLGDVGKDRHEMRHGAGCVLHGRDVDLGPQHAAIPARGAQHRAALAPFAHHGDDVLHAGLLGVGPPQQLAIAAGHFSGAVAGHLPERGIDVFDRIAGRFRADDDDAVEAGVDRLAQQLLRAAGQGQCSGAVPDQPEHAARARRHHADVGRRQQAAGDAAGEHQQRTEAGRPVRPLPASIAICHWRPATSNDARAWRAGPANSAASGDAARCPPLA